MLEIHEKAAVFDATGQQVGKVDRIVIDPLTHVVSHIVVRKGFFFPDDKVIPISAIDQAAAAGVSLVANIDLSAFPAFTEVNYVPIDPEDADEMIPAYLRASRLTPPLVWYGTVGMTQVPQDLTKETVIERNIPDRAVTLLPATPVLAAGRQEVGSVVEVISTDSGFTTHIVIDPPGMGTEPKAVPISWVEAITDSEVRLGVTARLVESIGPRSDSQ